MNKNARDYIKNYRRLRYNNDVEFREMIKKGARERIRKNVKMWKETGKCSSCGRKIDNKTKLLKDGTTKILKNCSICRERMRKCRGKNEKYKK